MKNAATGSRAAVRGDWVQIHNVVLTPEERTGHLPDDTKRVPLESWVKGFVQTDAVLGDEVEIETRCGRRVRGELVAINPGYEYGFGDVYVPELLGIGRQARDLLEEVAHA